MDRVETAQRSYNRLMEALSRADADLELGAKKESAIFMLMQYETFGFLGDASLAEITQHLGIGQQMARRYLSELEKAAIVRRVRKRNPLTFMLTEDFKREYGIEAPNRQTSTTGRWIIANTPSPVRYLYDLRFLIS